MTDSLRDLFLIDSDVVFFNHGSFGACPRPVFETYQNWQLELERQPIIFLGRRYEERMNEARAALAEYLGTAPDNMSFVMNATSGVNTVMRSLNLEPGDQILTTDHEYGSVNLTWEYMLEKSGIEIVRAPVAVPVGTEEEFVAALWEYVTPKTRLISISHITSPTAIIFPIEAICQRAREAGILTIIDGAHAPGQIPLDMEAIGADFYTGNCHKWMCAPKGAAFLYVRPDQQTKIDPLVISSGSRGDSPFQQRHSWQGTRDISAFLSVPAAIQFQKEHNWPSVQAQCHTRLQRLRHQLQDLTGLEPLTPDSTSWYNQMASLPLPQRDIEDYHHLYDDHKIEVPIFPWQDHILMRVSVQGYNTDADIDKLFNAIKDLVG